jgi:hypothetical protein
MALGRTTLTGGRSPLVGFVVPDDTTSLVITARAGDAVALTLAELDDPAGLSLVPKAWLGLAASPWICLDPCPNRIAAGPGEAAFLLPNTPLVYLPAGKWRLAVYGFSLLSPEPVPVPNGVEVDLQVDLVRKPPPARLKAKLAVNLCLTGANGVTADLVWEHARLGKAVETVRDVLGQAGVELDPLRAFDVAGAPLVIKSHRGPGNDLSALLRSGAGLPLGLNVFLVERMEAEGSVGDVLGLAGGVPGPPLAVGTARAGVAVSLQLGAGQPDLLGRAMAHEICHYLGLFHSSEAASSSGSQVHDNIPDTAQNDPENLMFWKLTDEVARLSPEQATVLHNSPWLDPVLP